MSMLGSKDNETRSYLEMVDALRQHGAAPQADMEALWRRMVFNILISNTDDHLRNHGFLYESQAGWRLSPAYDLNPVPTDIKPRILSTAINEDDNTASLALAMEVAGYFELDAGKARDIANKSARLYRSGAMKPHGMVSPKAKSTAWHRPLSMRTCALRSILAKRLDGDGHDLTQQAHNILWVVGPVGIITMPERASVETWYTY